MIRPPGMGGVVFSEAAEGDMRSDAAARQRLCDIADVPREWATARQVHGDDVVEAGAPGQSGQADALWTWQTGLPVAVFTADCFGVVLKSPHAAGVAHAGWRGARQRVVERLRASMSEAGYPPTEAAIGPGIGPCCFEVGDEVASEFEGRCATTRWGTQSVDLPAVISEQLEGLPIWSSSRCTYHHDGLFSHRADETSSRLAAVTWVE